MKKRSSISTPSVGGVDPATGAFVKSLGDKGKVELVIIRDGLIIPKGLTKIQFITLLEQYLIIKLRPAVNRKLLSISPPPLVFYEHLN